MEHFEYVQPIVDLLYNDDTTDWRKGHTGTPEHDTPTPTPTHDLPESPDSNNADDDDTPTPTDPHDEGDFRDNIVKFKIDLTWLDLTWRIRFLLLDLMMLLSWLPLKHSTFYFLPRNNQTPLTTNITLQATLDTNTGHNTDTTDHLHNTDRPLTQHNRPLTQHNRPLI